MDETLLAALGLTDKEAKLYKAVLKAKQIAPAELAKAAGIKRTTAYSMARGLVEKGLLVEDSTRRPRVFSPAAAEDLKAAIELEKKRSEERQLLLSKVAEGVTAFQAETTYPVPRIKFIEEDKIAQYFTQAFPVWIESMKEIGEMGFWGFQDASLVGHFEDQLHHWWKICPPESHAYILTNLTSAEKRLKGKYEQRHMKYWGEATDFISSTWICGDYVIMINTRQRPLYAIEIHSRLLAHDQREVFRNLWDLV